MTMTLTKLTRGAGVLAVAALAGAASGGPLIAPVGNPSNASLVHSGQYNMVEFTLSDDYMNVDIDAALAAESATSGTAYLMTAFGAGTTAADEVASTNFDFTIVGDLNTELGWTDLFSGLSLSAGTYYLVMASDDASGGGIQLNPSATYATDPNASVGSMYYAAGSNIDAGYAPASVFGTSALGNRFFRVSGDIVPAPATAALLGVAGLVGVRRRR